MKAANDFKHWEIKEQDYRAIKSIAESNNYKMRQFGSIVREILEDFFDNPLSETKVGVKKEVERESSLS